jgi:hypothetical protein
MWETLITSNNQPDVLPSLPDSYTSPSSSEVCPISLERNDINDSHGPVLAEEKGGPQETAKRSDAPNAPKRDRRLVRKGPVVNAQLPRSTQARRRL